MKTFSFIGMVAGIITLSAFTINNSINWKISDGYSIKFSSEDPSGVFTKLKGNIAFDENNLSTSSFDLEVDVNSINTGNGMQNKHAVGKKWFNAELYPTIHFVSEKFVKTSKGYQVMGTLEMHGVKKDFTMPFTFVDNTFISSFTVDRTEFDLGATKGMSAKVPHNITLDISVPVTK